MASRLQPLRTYPCTYAGCALSFNSKSDMKDHKEDDHYYCRKCNVDCMNWVDLTEHKVEVMAPHLECKMRGGAQSKSIHITCEFCGEDFESWDGRDLHRKRRHRAPQHIVCKGCDRIFDSATRMLDHLERDQCEAYTAFDFRKQIQHKHIVRQILQDGGSWETRKVGAPPPLSSITGTETGIDNKKGQDGASAQLINLDSPDDVNTVSKGKARAKDQEHWPGLPAEASASSEGPRKATLSDILFGVDRMGLKNDSVSTAVKATTTMADDLESVCATEGDDEHPNAWQTDETSVALFPRAKPTPATSEIVAMLENANKAQGDVSNIFSENFWDTERHDFDAGRFWDPLQEKYVCPLLGCSWYKFDDVTHLKTHLMWSHTKNVFICPSCKKRFPKPSVLMAHIESFSNCKIQRSSDFARIIDELSGGFLTTNVTTQPAIHRTGTDLVRSGQSARGVMKHQFQAKKPKEQPNEQDFKW